jgi:hypothetical protein
MAARGAVLPRFVVRLGRGVGRGMGCRLVSRGIEADKAPAFRRLTQALADLVGIVEDGGKIGPEA